MGIDHQRQQRTGAHRAAKLPAQRVESPMSMPIPRITPPPPRNRPAEKKKRKPRWGLLLIPLGILLAAAGVFGALYLLPGSIGNAEPGDCASYDRSNAQDPYASVGCGSSAAAFTVLQVIDDGGNCRDVPGATRSTVSTDGNARREVCLGPAGVDPATAVNVAQVGDCLTGTGTTGQERRVPCTDPTAAVKILARQNDVSKTQVNNACDRVPDATSVYTWTWDSDDGTGPAQASYQLDAVFCLGAVR